MKSWLEAIGFVMSSTNKVDWMTSFNYELALILLLYVAYVITKRYQSEYYHLKDMANKEQLGSRQQISVMNINQYEDEVEQEKKGYE